MTSLDMVMVKRKEMVSECQVVACEAHITLALHYTQPCTVPLRRHDIVIGVNIVSLTDD